MPTQHKFVVVASQRTGSTLLVRSLDSSPDIFCAGELFHTGPGVYHAEYQFPYRLLGSRMLSDLFRVRFRRRPAETHLKRFYAHAAPGATAVGFKLMVSQIQRIPWVVPFLVQQETTFIYLYRNNTFDTALSYYKALRSGLYHSDKIAKTGNPREIVADEKEFEGLVEICQNDKDQLMLLHRSLGGYLTSYEDMTARWDLFVSSIGERIGIPGLRVERTLTRVGEARGSIRVVNEDKLRERYSRLINQGVVT